MITQTKEVKIVTRNPHPRQAEFLNSTAKRKIIKAGRRSGKTVGVAIGAIDVFVDGRRVLYAAPTGEQTDKFWYEVKRALHPLVETGVYKLNETERYIEKINTENRIKAKTAYNANTLRGDYADLLILDEWQLMAEDTWEDVGAPMLLDNNGDAVFIYTPPSLKASGISRAVDPRHASKMFKKAQQDTTGRWATFHFTSYDNPHLDAESFKEITQDMSRESYLKEIMAEEDDVQLNLLVYGCWNETICKIKRMEIPSSWLIYTGHDFGCVDEETEILTKRGWQQQGDLIKGDKTLTFNLETGQSEWQPILKVNRFCGKRVVMRLMEQRGHSSFTTLNHRWAVEKRSGKRVFTTTENLKVNDRILAVAECSNLPTIPTYSDSFVQLIAWFWTEGQIDAGGVSLWQNEGEKAEQIRQCLYAEFGESLTRTRNGRERAVAGWVERPKRQNKSPTSGFLTEKELCHFAINLNGAKQIKKVAPHKIVRPEFITSLTSPQLRLFVETSIKGDGWQRSGRGKKKAGQSIDQSKAERLSPLQMACSLLGLRTTLAPVNGDSEKWLLSIHKRKHLYLSRAKKTDTVYDGLFWCPTTPNGTWFARRKGMSFFTGNSANPAALFIAQDPTTGFFYCYKEYCPPVGKSTYENVQAFKELAEERHVMNRVGGSHQEEEIRQGYATQGWPIAEPYITKVPVQIDRVKQLMEKNKVFIFSDMHQLLGEINTCLWKVDEYGKPTGVIKDEKRFHLLSCLRYICSIFNPEVNRLKESNIIPVEQPGARSIGRTRREGRNIILLR